jgi:hypothetical protein
MTAFCSRMTVMLGTVRKRLLAKEKMATSRIKREEQPVALGPGQDLLACHVGYRPPMGWRDRVPRHRVRSNGQE